MRFAVQCFCHVVVSRNTSPTLSRDYMYCFVPHITVDTAVCFTWGIRVHLPFKFPLDVWFHFLPRNVTSRLTTQLEIFFYTLQVPINCQKENNCINMVGRHMYLLNGVVIFRIETILCISVYIFDESTDFSSVHMNNIVCVNDM